MKQILDSLPTVWKLHSHIGNSIPQLGSSFPTGRKLPFYSWLAPSLS